MNGSPTGSKLSAAAAVLALSLLSPPAPAQGVIVCEGRLPLPVGDSVFQLPYCANRPLDAPAPAVERAVVAVHGSNRDADVYYQALTMAAGARDPSRLLLVAPQFLAEDSGGPEDLLRWSDWDRGGLSVVPSGGISSYEALEALLAAFADREQFPALETVVICGKSLGGNFVTRFAARSEAARTLAATVDLWFIASSSTSYLYFNEERQAPGSPSGFAPADRGACPSFNSGIYGLEDLAAPEQERILEAYPRTEIAYVAGDDDFGVFDSSCAALLQGFHVVDRALTYQRYLERVFGPEVRAYQSLVLVPGAAHSTELILTSPLVTPFLFETPPLAAFSLEPAAGVAPLEVAFDGSASRSFGRREIVAYDWDLGGGETASGPKAARSYDAPGRHAVKLRVTNDRGFEGELRRTLFVHIATEDVSPWRAMDIGATPFPGGARRGLTPDGIVAGGYGGLPIGGLGVGDRFHFVHQEVEGGMTLSAAVEQHVSGASWQAGVMLRSSLAPRAAYAAVALRGGGLALRAVFLHRDEDGGLAQAVELQAPEGVALELPLWLRIDRCGGDVIAFLRSEASSWQEVLRRALPWAGAEEAGSAGPELGGIFVLGPAPAEPAAFEAAQVSFRAVAMEPAAPACAPVSFRRGDANDDGQLDISDGIGVLGYLFLGAPGPACLDALDGDDTGALDLSDALRIFGFLFLGAPPPPAPGPFECGPDGTEDALGCDAACET